MGRRWVEGKRETGRRRGKAKLEEVMGKGNDPGKAAEMHNMNMEEAIGHLEKTGQTIGLPELTAAKMLGCG